MQPDESQIDIDSAQTKALSVSNLLQLEQCAVESKTLARMVHDYYANGSDGQITKRDNQDAFNRYKLLPRVLRDVSNVRSSTTVLGGLPHTLA